LPARSFNLLNLRHLVSFWAGVFSRTKRAQVAASFRPERKAVFLPRLSAGKLTAASDAPGTKLRFMQNRPWRMSGPFAFDDPEKLKAESRYLWRARSYFMYGNLHISVVVGRACERRKRKPRWFWRGCSPSTRARWSRYKVCGGGFVAFRAGITGRMQLKPG
jgi:hypothetical protein